VTNYYTDLFTPETWASFRSRGCTVVGFPKRQRMAAEELEEGDVLCCYMTKLSRWCGVVEVASGVYEDHTPHFTDPDPFVVRLKVRPVVVLEPELSIPISDPMLWPNLSITKNLPVLVKNWAQFAGLRNSLRKLSAADGALLVKVMREQENVRKLFPITRGLQFAERKIQGTANTVLVDVPDDDASDEKTRRDEQIVAQPVEADLRESLKVQARIAQIGVEMGFRVWVPRSDRQAIMDLLPQQAHTEVLDQLPLNYDDVTLKTIEQIDVIWINKRAMTRAFEVEHTTAIYSGLLRIADLLALQPNMNIKVHIVAPDERETKVLREIKRPVFSLLDRGPLYATCSFIPYSAVQEIAKLGHLRHMSDTVLEDFAVFAQEE
jgi:hypothetical protein